jgi:K+/H+ antiporter YhaU regulatory subunit KhtT|tara:strand:- start:219 stop:473 length:255 start_codon:yes stop_codon:yes gene_type:complete
MKNKNFEVFISQISEKDEHKKTKGYKKLSPKMKNAVDNIMKKMNDKPQNFLNSFDKSIKDTATKFKVTKNELMDYFEKELFAVM